MKRVLSKDIKDFVGKEVTFFGWVQSRRDHGKIIFIDLRDKEGIVQVVFIPQNKEVYKVGDELKSEYVVSVSGVINKRPKGMENPNIASGAVEVEAKSAVILNKSKTLPFEINDTSKINEETRLAYRYLDLRTERMRHNIVFRHKVIKYIRDFLDKEGFLEIETPVLTKSTPEGARDYLVPSRLQKGKFYALPQAPQQFKQLLMIAGFEKYFQIARCFRDEDQRGDRQPEFTQLDIEMSFPTQEEIINLTEKLYTEIVEKLADKKLTFKSFKRLTYKEAIEKHGTDSPDLRKNKKDPNELAFVWILDWPLFSWNKQEKRYDPNHHIFTAPKDEHVSLLEKEPLKVHSWQHDLVLNGEEIGGGSIRIHNREIQERIFDLVGIGKKEAQERFGHMLKAFGYGAPPHGGIALGLDRLLMILRNEPSIREVIAFPKTQEAKDLTMNAPTEVDPRQLKELGIRLEKKE